MPEFDTVPVYSEQGIVHLLQRPLVGRLCNRPCVGFFEPCRTTVVVLICNHSKRVDLSIYWHIQHHGAHCDSGV
jgi:hypothetical protein